MDSNDDIKVKESVEIVSSASSTILETSNRLIQEDSAFLVREIPVEKEIEKLDAKGCPEIQSVKRKMDSNENIRAKDFLVDNGTHCSAQPNALIISVKNASHANSRTNFTSVQEDPESLGEILASTEKLPLNIDLHKTV